MSSLPAASCFGSASLSGFVLSEMIWCFSGDSANGAKQCCPRSEAGDAGNGGVVEIRACDDLDRIENVFSFEIPAWAHANDTEKVVAQL